MAIVEQIKTDLTRAMGAGEKQKVGALRLVLSELQKAAKEGNDDELTVLRRERKRRLEAAEQFREGGREELAGALESMKTTFGVPVQGGAGITLKPEVSRLQTSNLRLET